MDHKIHFGYQIDPLWDIVKQIREKVATSLSSYSEELRDASAMTASELIENAVKYGAGITQNAGITFDFTADDRYITIVVANKILAQEDYEEVQQHIEQIHAAANPADLYLQRLQVLMEHPLLKKTQLGLFRIAYEGQFALSYTYTQNVLTITAVRAI